MSYYPTQRSYAQPYPSTSHHGHEHGHGYQPSNGYYEQQPASYGGQNVVYVPSSSHRSHRHRHRHGHEPTVISGTVVTSSGGRHGHHGHHGHGHRRQTIGERIRRFFGFGSRHYRYKSGESSWGFLGRSRRRKYVDSRTGAEVDRHGRQVYRV